MKTPRKWIFYAASLALLTGTCLAQSSTNPKEQHSGSATTGKMQSSTHKAAFFDAKSLIGTDIKNGQNQDLGDLKDVVFNPQSNETFATIDVGNDRCALVPWQALKITKNIAGKEEITLNTTKQALDSGPTVKNNDWQELTKRSFAQSIYQHYNLPVPASMGGVSASALGSHSTGTAKSSQSKS